METNRKNQTDPGREKYFNSIHRLGRICVLVAVIIMLGIPFILGTVLDVMPAFSDVFNSAKTWLLIFTPIGISETLAYTPLIGSAIYICLITGNLSNLKIPVALRATTLMDLEPSTEKADVVSTVAICASSIVTIVMLSFGVLLLTPLEPVLKTPEMGIATKHILPAIFGALSAGAFSSKVSGGSIINKRHLTFIVPAFVVTVATYLMLKSPNPMFYASNQGWLVIGSLIMLVVVSRVLYKRGAVTVSQAQQAANSESKAG